MGFNHSKYEVGTTYYPVIVDWGYEYQTMMFRTLEGAIHRASNVGCPEDVLDVFVGSWIYTGEAYRPKDVNLLKRYECHHRDGKYLLEEVALDSDKLE